jgi:hypothetical protein
MGKAYFDWNPMHTGGLSGSDHPSGNDVLGDRTRHASGKPKPMTEDRVLASYCQFYFCSVMEDAMVTTQSLKAHSKILTRA